MRILPPLHQTGFPQRAQDFGFLAGDGEMARRIREFDWSGTPIGAPQDWPAGLRTTVQTVLSIGHPALIVWGPQMVCLYNDAFRSSLGAEKHPGVLGDSAREAFAEVWPLFGADVEIVLSGGAVTGAENQLAPASKHSKLRDVYWTFSYSGIYDDSAPGGIGGVLVFCVETTKGLDAENALAFSEQQLRMATEAGEVGLWDVDLIRNTLYWPSSVRKMFGIFGDREVTLEGDFYPGLHPEDRERVMSSFAQALDPSSRAVYDVEYRTIGKEDNLIRWVAAKGRGFFDANGTCVRAIGTVVDTTERKRSETRLQQLNEMLEQRLIEHFSERKLLSDIMEHADTLIQALDLDFRWLAVNRACADAFELHYGKRPKVGESILDALQHQPEQRELVRDFWQRGLTSDGFVATEAFGQAPGPQRTYEMHFGPLYDSQAKRLGAYQFVYDVTERHQAEHRLAQAELALANARKLETVGLVTGGIAHDFNNILQALSTKFELMRRRPDDANRISTWANDGLEAIRRGTRLTSQLMTFSRQQEPDIRPVDVQKLLAGMSDLLRTTAGPTVRLTVDCPEAWVSADSTQLEMALLNLAVNARDAMPSGGKLTITVAAGSLNGQRGPITEIRVRDSGIGMTAEVLSRAFEPFYTTKDVGRGSGLGLSQVYSMSRRAGGSVNIESDGQTFTQVTIQLRSVPSESAVVDEGLERPDDAAGVVARTLLVVDDDREVRLAIVQSLTSFGHEVLEAESGEAGLEILTTRKVDMLLVDYAMPGMTGATTAKLARGRHHDLPIVFMSGYADVEAIRDAVGHDATLLRKPFELEELQRVVRRAAAP